VCSVCVVWVYGMRVCVGCCSVPFSLGLCLCESVWCSKSLQPTVKILCKALARTLRVLEWCLRASANRAMARVTLCD
jgi:hypothetical protein